MSAFHNRSAGEHELVGRINSEHLSEQFQRELSNTREDELLQDRELRIDDIHSASGMQPALLLFVQAASITWVQLHCWCRQRHRSTYRYTARCTEAKAEYASELGCFR